MAELHSTPAPDQYGFPRPPILKPEEYEPDEHMWNRWYTLNTSSGSLRVEESGGRRGIVGTVEALTAYGLMRPEWAPGLPGNASARQTVLFEDGDYHYPKGKLYRTPMNAIAIEKAGKKFRVLQLCTPEEKAVIEPCLEKLREERRKVDRAKPVAERPPSAQEWNDATKFAWLLLGNGRAEIMLNEFKGHIEQGPYRYTDASHARILRCMAELRTAVREGVAEPREAERQRVGCWRAVKIPHFS